MIEGKKLDFWIVFLAAALGVFVLYGCARTDEEGETMDQIQVSSSAFDEGEMMVPRYSCDGQNVSPPLSWMGVPKEAESLALIVNDPDASRGSWAHWVVYNMEPGLTELPEGVDTFSGESRIGMEGKNDFGDIGYGGPCPPRGTPHRYQFKVYALDTSLDLPQGATKSQIERAMEGHILAQGQLMARYQRQ